MSLCLCLQGGERSFPKLNILGLSRGGSIPKIGQFEYLGQNGRPLMGPQMEMSSLVLTIHNFGVPNFDPYPYVLRSALVWFKRSEIFVGTTCMRLRLSIHSWSWVLRNQTSMGKAMVSTVSTGNDVYITCFLFGGFSLS